jgi:hypothetical protein
MVREMKVVVGGRGVGDVGGGDDGGGGDEGGGGWWW